MISDNDKAQLKNRRELNKILKTIPKDRKSIGARLVDELLFMADTLTALKDEVRKSGAVDHFKQGKQQFMRESPALKAYNTTIQRYSLIYRQLTDLMPKPVFSQSTEDKLLAFLASYTSP